MNHPTLNYDYLQQADDPRHHLPPVIIMDGLLGRIRAGEDVPLAVEAVLRWCWTVAGGRRLAHVVRDYYSLAYISLPHSGELAYVGGHS